mmetsp:Transcript_4014/g.5825  ORF Transcript_4014/g.5825 Transcript_4014/m.5825 type:complete len:406 (-) Transcript_4014:35-1252(-)
MIVYLNNYVHTFIDDKGDGLYNTKYRKGQHKESKEARRARNKVLKLEKFNPDRETTREEKARVEREEYELDSNNDDDDAMDHIQDDHEEEAGGKGDEKTDTSEKASKPSNNNPNMSRIEELRAKLRAKLEEKRSQRPGGNGNSDSMVSKRAARRAEKQRRVELAKKRKASASSSGSTQTGKNKREKITLVKDLGGSKINETLSKGVSDDLSGIDFGGIAGLKNNLSGNYTDANKSLKNKGKKKSLEKLLEEAETKKERLRQLKESDDAEDKEKAKKIQWGDTLKAASGQSMKESNPTLLKKAMKRKARKKAKSQEAWKSRMEQTKEKMDERQRIRSHNVKQRALGGAAGANLSKKRIKDDVAEEDNKETQKRPRLGPYGKSRAGFEGKKQDFINKGSESKNVTTQ